MNGAIITARKGSKDKNMWMIDGIPVVAFPLAAAKRSKSVDETWVTTDSYGVMEEAEAYRATVIKRPKHLCGDDVNHGAVIAHAVGQIGTEYDTFVVLLGNTIMTSSALISEALATLEERPEIDSVMSVLDLSDNHPMRALQLTPDGFLQSYGEPRRNSPSTNRQDYKPAYLFDGGVWAFRRRNLAAPTNSVGPWWWMGERCLPLVRPWTPVRDIHDEVEVAVSEWWLRRQR